MAGQGGMAGEFMGGNERGGVFKLLYALPPVAGALIPTASQIIEAGKLTVLTAGPGAGNYVIEMSRQCLMSPACVEAAKNPLQIGPIIAGLVIGAVVSAVIVTAKNIITGMFSTQ